MLLKKTEVSFYLSKLSNFWKMHQPIKKSEAFKTPVHHKCQNIVQLCETSSPWTKNPISFFCFVQYMNSVLLHCRNEFVSQALSLSWLQLQVSISPYKTQIKPVEHCNTASESALALAWIIHMAAHVWLLWRLSSKW